MPFDPMTALAIGSVAAPVIGGLMGNSAAKKGAAEAAAMRQQAQANIEEAVRALEAIGIPTVDAQKIALESPELVGLLVPELAGPSAHEGIQVSPEALAAQKGALSQLREQSTVGLTAEDLAKFEELRSGLKNQQQSTDAGILASMAERGTLGSGNELAVRLNAAQRNNQEALENQRNIAAQAVAARREALLGMSNLGGQMRDQSFNEQESVARAKDAINMFNTTNRQDIAGKNLQMRQNASDANIATRNEQEKYNKNLLQQDFHNRMGKAQAIAGARTQSAQNQLVGAGQALQAGANKAQAIGQIAGGVTNALGAYGTSVEAGKRNDYLDEQNRIEREKYGIAAKK